MDASLPLFESRSPHSRSTSGTVQSAYSCSTLRWAVTRSAAMRATAASRRSGPHGVYAETDDVSSLPWGHSHTHSRGTAGSSTPPSGGLPAPESRMQASRSGGPPDSAPSFKVFGALSLRSSNKVAMSIEHLHPSPHGAATDPTTCHPETQGRSVGTGQKVRAWSEARSALQSQHWPRKGGRVHQRPVVPSRCPPSPRPIWRIRRMHRYQIRGSAFLARCKQSRAS